MFERKNGTKMENPKQRKIIIIAIIGIILVAVSLLIAMKESKTTIEEGGKEVENITNNQEENTELVDNHLSIYDGYLQKIKEYEDKIKNKENSLVQYALTDMNEDGTQELVIQYGTSNADYQYIFYTYKNNSVVELGSTGGNSNLYKMKEENYVKQVFRTSRRGTNCLSYKI